MKTFLQAIVVVLVIFAAGYFTGWFVFKRLVESSPRKVELRVIAVPAQAMATKEDTAKGKSLATTERDWDRKMAEFAAQARRQDSTRLAAIDSMRIHSQRVGEQFELSFRDTVEMADSTGTVLASVIELHTIMVDPVSRIAIKRTEYSEATLSRIEIRDTVVLRPEISFWERLRYRAEGGVIVGGIVVLLFL